MSAAHEAHPDPHDSHDAADHGHAPFDGEPTTTLPDDEPRTPGWLPLVGLAVFAVGGFLLFGGELPAPPEKPAAPVAVTKPVTTVVPPDGVLRPAPSAAPLRAPSAGAATAVKAAIERDPEKVKEVNRRLMENRGAQPPAPAAPPPPR